MFYVLKQPRRLIYFASFIIKQKNQRLINTNRHYSCVNYNSMIRLFTADQCKVFLMTNDQSSLILSRNKHSKKKKHGRKYDEESSDEEVEDEYDDDDDDDFVEDGAEVKSHNVKSLRVDAVLKAGLGISRKKILDSFYENKIRVNGEVLQKKSQNVQVNDEVDLIKGYTNSYSGSIVVGRMKILKIQPNPDTDNIIVKAWKNKSLEIKNYKDVHAWREPTVEESN